MSEQHRFTPEVDCRVCYCGKVESSSVHLPPPVEPVAGAREFRKAWSHKPTPIPAHDATNELWYSESCAEQLMEAYASSQLKKLDGVAQEAANEIEKYTNGLPEYSSTVKVREQITAIISKLIAERLSK